MLVLSRKAGESVVLSDVLTLTVEDITDQEGQTIRGARVRLGFESPRHVNIYRSEWRQHGAEHAGSGRFRRPERLEGKTVRISDARFRLRIELPTRVPVKCDHRPIAQLIAPSDASAPSAAQRVTVVVTCQDEDRITICHNIVVSTLDCRRFVRNDRAVEQVGTVS